MSPVSQGELAFPDCQKYFIAAQLVAAVWWLFLDVSNPAAILELAVIRSMEAGQALPWILVGPWDPGGCLRGAEKRADCPRTRDSLHAACSVMLLALPALVFALTPQCH